MKIATGQGIQPPRRLWSDPDTIAGVPVASGLAQSRQLIPSFTSAGVGLGQQVAGSYTYSCVTSSDGALWLPIAGQNGSSASNLSSQAIDVLTTDGCTTRITVPSTTGAYNRADLSDAKVFYDSGGVEHVVANSAFPYNGWNIGTNGEQPCLAVFTKTGGTWAYDSSMSVTTRQLYESNPTLCDSTGCIYLNSVVVDQTFYNDNAITEIDPCASLPGFLACVQYFSGADGPNAATPNPAISTHSTCLMIVDLNNGTLAGAWRAPDITDMWAPSSPPINLTGRSVAVDPTSSPTDIRVLWFHDTFSNLAVQTIASVSSSGGLVTITTATAHGFGPGLWVAIAKLPGKFAAINDPSFESGTQMIVSVPSSTSFCIAVPGFADVTTTAVAAGTATAAENRPFWEMSCVPGDPWVFTPTTQVLFTGTQRGNVGTGIFNSAGDLFVDTSSASLDFRGGPSRCYRKTGGNRSYVTTAPYNPATFANSYGAWAPPDDGFGHTQVTYGFNSSIALDPAGVLYKAETGFIDRVQLPSSWPSPVNIMSDPNFTGGSFAFGGFYGQGAYGTAYGSPCLAITNVPATVGLQAPSVWITEQHAVTIGANEEIVALCRASAGAVLPVSIGLQPIDAYGITYNASLGEQAYVDSTQWWTVRAEIQNPTNAAFGLPNSRPAVKGQVVFDIAGLPQGVSLYVKFLSWAHAPGTVLTPIYHGANLFPVQQWTWEATGSGTITVGTARTSALDATSTASEVQAALAAVGIVATVTGNAGGTLAIQLAQAGTLTASAGTVTHNTPLSGIISIDPVRNRLLQPLFTLGNGLGVQSQYVLDVSLTGLAD